MEVQDPWAFGCTLPGAGRGPDPLPVITPPNNVPPRFIKRSQNCRYFIGRGGLYLVRGFHHTPRRNIGLGLSPSGSWKFLVVAIRLGHRRIPPLTFVLGSQA